MTQNIKFNMHCDCDGHLKLGYQCQCDYHIVNYNKYLNRTHIHRPQSIVIWQPIGDHDGPTTNMYMNTFIKK